MHSILNFVQEQMHNQIIGGGMVLLVSGALMGLLRNFPAQLCAWVKRRTTIELEVLNSDPLFDYITFWLDSQPYSKRSRSLTGTIENKVLESIGDDGDGDKDAPVKVLLSPAPGTHFLMHHNHFLWLSRRREANSSGLGGRGQGRAMLKSEIYTIIVFGRSQEIIRSMMDDIVKFGSIPSNQIKIYNSSFGYWRSSKQISPRKLESVIMPNGVSDSIVSDVKKFLSGGPWYRDVGIPWHRGYLFYGIPGSGKSSLVVALAGELKLNLYVMNLSGMDDEQLGRLMAEVNPGSIILMEDVDCTAPGRDKKEKGVTLSGLLNCIDGVQSREGCMVFMTTNFKDSLDSALIRPGRVDVSIEFGFATREQAEALRDRLCPGSPVPDHEGRTMAEIQQELLGRMGFTSNVLSASAAQGS